MQHHLGGDAPLTLHSLVVPRTSHCRIALQQLGDAGGAHRLGPRSQLGRRVLHRLEHRPALRECIPRQLVKRRGVHVIQLVRGQERPELVAGYLVEHEINGWLGGRLGEFLQQRRLAAPRQRSYHNHLAGLRRRVGGNDGVHLSCGHGGGRK